MVIKAGILAIGNEVVEGQITNRNASWLATQLSSLNIRTTHHLACVDDPQSINDSLDFLNKFCDLILVSGGLGPTKDDCTRQSLSKWLGHKLVFNEEQWESIEALLKSRNLTIREGHRNQAHFPETSQILLNPTGVAPGFFIQTDKACLASLPGPPSELCPMYSEYLVPLLNENLNSEEDKRLYKWVCLGAPESDLAHITESLLMSQNHFDIGYRLHKPYVEIKVWGPKELSDQDKKLFQKLEEKLKPWFVSHEISDIRKEFHESLSHYEGVYIIDHLTQGQLLDKIKEDYQSDHIRYQNFEKKAFRHFSKEEVQSIYQHMKSNDKQLFICLFPHSETSAIAFLNDEFRIIDIPRKYSVKSKIGMLYAIENLFLFARETLKK